jgi:hypothetical protein
VRFPIVILARIAQDFPDFADVLRELDPHFGQRLSEMERKPCPLAHFPLAAAAQKVERVNRQNLTSNTEAPLLIFL